jgi:uncharacterized protein YndB with AHSA1/START domain
MVQSNIVTVLILFVILAGPLRGEVVETTAADFLVRNTAAINAPPANVYAALTDKVGGWWDPAHTFSHDARNLSLDARAGGCFCERLPDGGGVQHMRFVYASPGKLLRLTGAIGPLQEAALVGTMTWTLLQAGSGTTVELSYTVSGLPRRRFSRHAHRRRRSAPQAADPAQSVRRNRSSRQVPAGTRIVTRTPIW